MKKIKNVAIVMAVILVIGVTSVTAFAASGYTSPAQIITCLTGKSIESVIADKTESGSTYGAIASEAGVLDEFKAQMLEQRKANLSERVTAGTMTQERADEIIAAMEENQANCDGSGTGSGMCSGTCTGTGAGLGNSAGNRGGGQNGSGRGMGACLTD